MRKFDTDFFPSSTNTSTYAGRIMQEQLIGVLSNSYKASFATFATTLKTDKKTGQYSHIIESLLLWIFLIANRKSRIIFHRKVIMEHQLVKCLLFRYLKKINLNLFLSQLIIASGFGEAWVSQQIDWDC